jgi:hypothetical protein
VGKEQRLERRLRRRLAAVHGQLAAAREAVTVAEEQLAAFVDEADEAHVRSIVTENTSDVRTSSAAERHRELMERVLVTARQRVRELEVAEGELLEQLRV